MDSKLALAALLVSLFSFALSYAETRKQRAISSHQARLQRDLDLIHWAQEGIEALVEAWSLARMYDQGASTAAFAPRIDAVERRLSAAVDKGRFYLPNVLRKSWRADVQPPSRRGYRHAALDELVAVYEALDQMRTGVATPGQIADQMFENRRWFIDAIVDEIRPGLHVAFVQRITDRQKVPSPGRASVK